MAADKSKAQSRDRLLKRTWRLRPRPETVLLAAAAGVTVAAKLGAVREYQPANLLTAWASVIAADVTFFATLALLIAVACALWPGRLTARCALALVLLTLLWSLTNALWLKITGVQLQTGVLSVILQHPAEFWPTVRPRVVRLPSAVIAGGGLTALLVLTWIVWRFVRPLPVALLRRRHWWRAGGAAAAIVVGAIAPHCGLPAVGMGSLGQVLDFSSHAYALLSPISGNAEVERQTRSIPRVGERDVKLPPGDLAQQPNIVLLLLESVSHKASGLDDPEHPTMPQLAQLAVEGVQFVNTRVPVSQTGKAFWSTLAGVTPDIYHDYSEAILVDEPYEGLPALLGRVGYRSAFFQMAKGTFECAPATFANFAFDWAWFRENLEDPSADLGYLAGDDFRMLDPALEWIGQDEQPFLLFMITSVAHDPYEVPAWFAEPAESDYERYMQTVQYTDDFIGELRQRLEQRGLADNTLLCVLGDHGDSFRPEARHTRWVAHEEVLRIPWVIHWPGHVPAGERCEWPCSQLDVTPTLLRLLGYDIGEAGFEGRDARTPAPANRRLYFSSWFEGSPLGYVEGSRKWLYWPHNGKVFAYNLDSDPGELTPVPVTGPERDGVEAALLKWQRDSFIEFHARRFRKRFLFDHWWAFSSGRYGRAYYVP